MSIFEPAFWFTMKSEDPLHQWKRVKDSCPRGCEGPCFAISGINSGAWPEDFAAVNATPQAERQGPVMHFYESRIWTSMHADLLDDQDLANRVMDEGTWSGPGTGVKLLQRAINALQRPGQPELTVDGLLGEKTAGAANSATAAALLDSYRSERLAYLVSLEMYQEADPEQQANYRRRALA